jgi:hypothetical protein
LYDTQARGVAGGATGLVDITSAGATVNIFPCYLVACYKLVAAFKNTNGNTAIVGSVVKDVMEDVSGWDTTIEANDSADTAEIKATPDTVLGTRFSLTATYTTFSCNP